MNSIGASILISLLLFSLVSVHLTASASFPNPPQRPPSDASPDEQALFWKLLHNYYAIIARPRFGKRSDLGSMYSKHPLYLRVVKSNSDSAGISSESEMNRMFHENIPNDRIDVDNSYSFEYPIRRRR